VAWVLEYGQDVTGYSDVGTDASEGGDLGWKRGMGWILCGGLGSDAVCRRGHPNDLWSLSLA
jgi:hypothetical protein